jgi:hypothetical protein
MDLKTWRCEHDSTVRRLVSTGGLLEHGSDVLGFIQLEIS